MNEKNDVGSEAVDRTNRILRKFQILYRKPHDYGNGEILSNSQIHLIDAIGQTPLATVTELARSVGVTKGACSQLAGKLFKKGYITKMREVGNNKEVRLILTKKGEKIRNLHEEFHRQFMKDYFQGVTSDEGRIYNDIMKRIEAYVDYRLETG